MWQRNSIHKSQKPTTTLRRSPKLLQQNQSNRDDDPKTPKPEPRKMRVSNRDPTPFSSIRKGPLNKSQKERRGEVSEKAKETHLRLKASMNLSTEQRRSAKLSGVSKDSLCLRRSPRFSADYNVKGVGCDKSKQADLCKKSDTEIGWRVTRRGVNKEGATGNGKGYNEVIDCIPGEVPGMQRKSDNGNSSKQCLSKIEKRVTRSTSCGTKREDIEKCGDVKGEKPIQNALFKCLDKGVLSNEGYSKMDMQLSKQCMSKAVDTRKYRTILSADSTGGGDKREFANEVENNLPGVKRKRDEANEGHRIVQEWTKEQELALQRAYFAATPSPHFWKKVSKMVPGKSAQDCFDKIHSDHLTPPQPKPRSRAKATNSSSLLFSASKLLSSSEPKCKKLRQSKQKSFLSHKAVQELLQKQCKIDQDNKADHFTVLEPTLDPSIRIIPDGTLFATPECNTKEPGFLKRCWERSSAHRKHLSRLNASCGATLTSPPVLKQVKNKVLHDKYINQLHTREAKRKAASLRAAKCTQGKNDAKQNDIHRSEAVKAAKDALIFDVGEAIDQFHHLQKSMANNDDVYDDFADIAEDDTEDTILN